MGVFIDLLMVRYCNHFRSRQQIVCITNVFGSNCPCHIFFHLSGIFSGIFSVYFSRVCQQIFCILSLIQRCSCHKLLCVCRFCQRPKIFLTNQIVYWNLKSRYWLNQNRQLFHMFFVSVFL